MNNNNNNRDVDDQSLQTEEEREDDDDDDDTDEGDEEEEEDTDDDEDDSEDDDDDEEVEQKRIRQQRFKDKLEAIPQIKLDVPGYRYGYRYGVDRNMRRIKSIKILQRRDEFPLRQRGKIDTSLGEIFDHLDGDSSNAVAIDVTSAVDAAAFNNAAFNNAADIDNDLDAAEIVFNTERRLKLLLLLQRLNEVPDGQRNTIDVLIDMFLDDLEDDIHEMLCDQDAAHYRGLDNNRDTEKQVRNIVELFPNLTSQRNKKKWDVDAEGEWIEFDTVEGEGDFPIQCLVYMCNGNYNGNLIINVKAIPFIALLAQLAIEFSSFEDHERGGVLLEDESHANTLHNLVSKSSTNDTDENNQLIDNVCLVQLVRLKRMGLFKKEDISTYDHLLHRLCRNYYFSERRFQFLIQWDPTSLLEFDDVGGMQPLHWVAEYCSIQSIRIAFEYCIRYYPKKKGILLMFTKYCGDSSPSGPTPFRSACERYGRDEVMEDIVEDTISCYYSEETPLNIANILLTAAIEKYSIHLDCVFFLLRRQPDVLVDLQLGDGDNSGDNSGKRCLRDNNDGDYDGDDREDNDTSNHEKGRADDDNDNMQIANTDTDTDENKNDRKRELKRKRKSDS